MKKRQHSSFTVNTDTNKNRTIFIDSGCEYPETKDEGLQELRSSTKVISKELLYMLGCIHYFKASFLQPDSKKKWFDSILEVMDNIDEIEELLSEYPYPPVNEDDMPF